MKPISKNKSIEDFSKENDLDPKYVNSIVSIYFKEVKHAMNSLDHIRVKIPNLGKMIMLYYKLDYKITHLKNLLNYIPPTSFKNIDKYKLIEERLHKYINLKKKYEEEEEEIRVYKEKRKANRPKDL